MPTAQHAKSSKCQILNMLNPQHANSSICQHPHIRATFDNLPKQTSCCTALSRKSLDFYDKIMVPKYLHQPHTPRKQRSVERLCAGFFLAGKGFGRLFDHSCSTVAFFFFFKVEISLLTLIAIFRPGSVHSGSVT